VSPAIGTRYIHERPVQGEKSQHLMVKNINEMISFDEQTSEGHGSMNKQDQAFFQHFSKPPTFIQLLVITPTTAACDNTNNGSR
jgi:hypothetical protein